MTQTISDDVRAADVLTRDEAIDRMKAGLPCETSHESFDDGPGWTTTRWEHFDPPYSHVKFRKPPEPRRVARQFTITWRDGTYRVSIPNYEGGEVREVLPGDVTVQRSAIEEIAKWADSGRHEEDFEAIANKLRELIGEGS